MLKHFESIEQHVGIFISMISHISLLQHCSPDNLCPAARGGTLWTLMGTIQLALTQGERSVLFIKGCLKLLRLTEPLKAQQPRNITYLISCCIVCMHLGCFLGRSTWYFLIQRRENTVHFSGEYCDSTLLLSHHIIIKSLG